MEPQTLEMLTSMGIAAGIATGMTASLIGGFVGIYKLRERKHLVDQIMPNYENGLIEKKPNIFNIYSIDSKSN